MKMKDSALSRVRASFALVCLQGVAKGLSERVRRIGSASDGNHAREFWRQMKLPLETPQD